MEVIRKKGIKGWRIVGHNKKVFYAIIIILILLIGIGVYLIFEGNKSQELGNNSIANPALFSSA